MPTITKTDLAILQAAIPDPSRLEVLACYFDQMDKVRGITGQTGVQDDLRRWATAGALALKRFPRKKL